MPHDADLALAARVLEKRPGAWEDLAARVTPALTRAAGRILARCAVRAEAADLVQETLASLLELDGAALKAYSGRASLDTYLAAIAAHRARRMAGERRLLPLDEGVSQAPAPDAALLAGERQALIREAIAQLPPRDGLAIRLHLDGASLAETGRVLGVTASHAGVLLSRARERLRPLLQKIGEGL